MIYNLLIAIILIVAFFMTIKAYTLGFKHGKDVSKAITPTLNINPIKAVKQHIEAKEEKKKEELELEGWNGENGILNYDPYKEMKEGE
jgi:hypothetical protein